MRRSNVTLLDLANEILLIILKKLKNMDVLYSLLDIDNQRLDMLVREETFSKSLNFILTTITDDVLPIADSTLDRFCMKIIPKIDYNVKSLILESRFMERILLTADYPNLTELKLYNLNDHIISHHFTDRKLQWKSSTTWLSLNLNKLCVDVDGFQDCLALLDGRLIQLTTFIVEIATPEDDFSTIYNMDNLPNMKCFSLKCHCSTDEYDTRILPLLRRMIKLEELTLDIINDERTTFIDGIQINDQILVRTPCLRKFTFHISTEVKLYHLIHYPSNEDIQRTFINIGYEQVCCILNYVVGTAISHVFSLPFTFDEIRDIGNSFPPLDFSRVTRLRVQDKIAFKHEFFLRIARTFPLLRELHVLNLNSQSEMRDNSVSNNNELYSAVEYPNLISLRLQSSHIEYVALSPEILILQ